MGSHLKDGQFQSDKYPTYPPGKVPLSVKDKTAQDLLWTYAQRRLQVDAEFSDDLETALRVAGYAPRRDDGWTKIGEDPDTSVAPWDGQPVLVATDDLSGEARYQYDGRFYWGDGYPADAHDSSVKNPKWWQPLPTPPQMGRG